MSQWRLISNGYMLEFGGSLVMTDPREGWDVAWVQIPTTVGGGELRRTSGLDISIKTCSDLISHWTEVRKRRGNVFAIDNPYARLPGFRQYLLLSITDVSES